MDGDKIAPKGTFGELSNFLNVGIEYDFNFFSWSRLCCKKHWIMKQHNPMVNSNYHSNFHQCRIKVFIPIKCKFGSKIWIGGGYTIDFGIDGNLSKFIITLGSFVSKVGANLTTPLTYSNGSKCWQL